MKNLLPLPVALWIMVGVVLVGLAADRWIFHPVGRYQHFGNGMARIDTVTGRVDIWHGEGDWTQQVDPKTARMVATRTPAGWVELGK